RQTRRCRPTSSFSSSALRRKSAPPQCSAPSSPALFRYVAKSYDLAVKKEDARTVDLSFDAVGKALARFRASHSFSTEILISGYCLCSLARSLCRLTRCRREKTRLQEEVASGLRGLVPCIHSAFALIEGKALD